MRFKFKEERQGKTISMSSALSLILEEYGLKDSVIIEKIRSGWHGIAGNLMAVHSIPNRIFKDILFISVDHPVYSNELFLMKEIIVNKINEELGSQIIKDIKLEIKKLDWEKRCFKNV